MQAKKSHFLRECGRAVVAMPAVAVLLAGIVAAPPGVAADVAAIHVFKGVNHGGVDPEGALLETAAGELWGATAGGGPQDDGTLFKFSADGQFESVISPAPTVARKLVGDLVQAPDSTIFGVATWGGEHDGGSLFAFDGTQVSLVHSFDSSDGWGSHPTSGMLLAPDGRLYGVLGCCGSDGPLVYSLDPATREWAILGFLPTTCSGYGPRPVEGTDGDFYVAATAGEFSCVVRMNHKGEARVIHAFGHGEWLQGVIAGSDGSLYGTLAAQTQNCGAIFRMSTSGKLDRLHKFECDSLPLGRPQPGLLQAADGSLHGSIDYYDGRRGHSFDVWSMAPDGSGYTESPMPRRAGLGTNMPIQAGDGALYATAPGGKFGNGTVVRVTP